MGKPRFQCPLAKCGFSLSIHDVAFPRARESRAAGFGRRCMIMMVCDRAVGLHGVLLFARRSRCMMAISFIEAKCQYVVEASHNRSAGASPSAALGERRGCCFCSVRQSKTVAGGDDRAPGLPPRAD